MGRSGWSNAVSRPWATPFRGRWGPRIEFVFREIGGLVCSSNHDGGRRTAPSAVDGSDHLGD